MSPIFKASVHGFNRLNLDILSSVARDRHKIPPEIESQIMPCLTPIDIEIDEPTSPFAIDAHKASFYHALDELDSDKHFNKRLMDGSKCNLIVGIIKRHEGGVSIAQLRREGHGQVDKYIQKYMVRTFEADGDVLLEEPKKNPDGTPTPLDQIRRVITYEKLFDGLMECHIPDHPKGLTLYHRVSNKYCNVPRNACKLFTETCPKCIERIDKRKSIAGHQLILTHGFGSRGQIDLVDFQNMPDGNFKFLLNYLDHGTKIAYSTALVSKRAASVALVLMDIFTLFGPPSILQADNGREFYGAATLYHSVLLSDAVR